MAIIKNRQTVYNEQLLQLEQMKTDIMSKIKAIEEGNPINEDNLPNNKNELNDKLSLILNEISDCKNKVDLEQEKHKNWKVIVI